MDLDKKNDECNNLYSKNDKKLNPFEKVSCTTKQSYLFLISPFYLKKIKSILFCQYKIISNITPKTYIT